MSSTHDINISIIQLSGHNLAEGNSDNWSPTVYKKNITNIT